MPLMESDKLLEKRIFRFLNKGMKDFSLIDDGDRILIGLSGGKDSLCLTEFLGKRARIKRPDFTVEALHIRMKNIDYESDTSYLQEFCSKNGVRLHIVETCFSPDKNHKRTPCFLCSWTRRKELFTFAQQNGFNKIALGHHNDDILHTLLMNEIFEGTFSTMPVKLQYKKMALTLIRPLCKIRETDLRTWAKLNGYQPQRKKCPYERDTNRTRIKELLEQMEALNPELRYSLWHALEKDKKLIES